MSKFVQVAVASHGDDDDLVVVAVDADGRVWESWGTMNRDGFENWIQLPEHPHAIVPEVAGRPVIFGCGCTFHPEPDPNGIAPWLQHCREHEAAGDLLEALEALTDPEGHIPHGSSGECTGECRAARVAIARARGILDARASQFLGED